MEKGKDEEEAEAAILEGQGGGGEEEEEEEDSETLEIEGAKRTLEALRRASEEYGEVAIYMARTWHYQFFCETVRNPS